MMATRQANATQGEIEKELENSQSKREQWAVSAKKKRIDPDSSFIYPDLECYSMDFIVNTYRAQWICTFVKRTSSFVILANQFLLLNVAPPTCRKYSFNLG